MFISFLHCLVLFLLRLRYKVHVRGAEALQELRGKGALFLPNHPAEIDPVILMGFLWRPYRPRPLIVDTFYRKKGIHFFMRCVRALAVPSFDEGGKNGWKVHKLQEVFHKTAEGLRQGDHFLIYPSGRLKVDQNEKLGGASFVYNLLQECPDVPLVLIRTRGLWGSRFSRAVTGSVPQFGSVLKEGLVLLLKNGIFFMPKRDVYVDIELAPASFPRAQGRLACNAYLEKWYNNCPDLVQQVSDYFWKTSYSPVYSQKDSGVKELEVPQSVREAVVQKMAELVCKPTQEISPDLDLSFDLGLDSLDMAQIYLFLDAAYDVEKNRLPPLRRVIDVMQAAAQASIYKAVHVGSKEPKQSMKRWFKETKRPSPRLPEDKTIQGAFISTCKYMAGHIACADGLSGIWSYRKLLFVVRLLSRVFQKLPEHHVGVMMPSSVAAYTVILALLLAKKVPVMLNWTIGVRALDHAFTLTDMKQVISADKFLDRIEQPEWGKVLDHLLCLEEIKERFSWKDKVGALIDTIFYKKADEGDSCAVILFTSGTENVPKAVPLTHNNLLSNQRAALTCIRLQAYDTMHCMLPPFHSFGFSVTGLLPLLCGIRAYYAPDPTDAKSIVEDIACWKPTLLCSAPSFLQNIFQCAVPKQLSSLRLVVGGAEKVAESLFAYVAKECPWIELLEGYGITECSPVVTLCRPGLPHVGVGSPLPGIELRVIEDQEICIYGPNVFSGYLGSPSSCFLQEGEKTWYRSGDRGCIDAEGNLILLGRLKRFIKIGGEMVSLVAVEEAFIAHIPAQVDGPSFAVNAREKEGEKTTITLFTPCREITKEKANHILQDAGFSTLIKIGRVHYMDKIPLTGTGKIHYRALDEMELCT